MQLRKALVFSYLEKYSSLLIAVLSSMALARLLTPEQIGVYSVSAVFVGLASSLRDLGAGTYIVQEKELNNTRIRATFTVALGVGALFSLILFLLSSPVSQFYEEDGVRMVMLVLAANFLIVPFGSVTQALLTRDMQFKHLAKVRVISTLVNALTGVYLAYRGFGFMSLAWAALASTCTSALMTNIYRPKGVPFLPGIKDIGRVTSFGSRRSFSSLLNEIGTGAPDLVIGRILGFDAAGFFSRAMGLVMLFNRLFLTGVFQVSLPHFAERHRRGDDIKVLYSKAILYITGLAWPFFIYLAFTAYPIVRILYGDQWDNAVPLVRILCVALSISFLTALSGHVLTAIGEVGRTVRINLVIQPVKVIIVVISAFYGLEMIALGLIVSSLFSVGIVYRHLKACIEMTFIEYLSILSKNIPLVFLTGLVPAIVYSIDLQSESILVAFLVSTIGGGIGFLAGIFLFKHPFGLEARTIAYKIINR